MNIKIIMDSGKEYFSDKDKTAGDFIRRSFVGSRGIKFIPLNIKETVWINTNNISSVEEL